MFVYQFFRELSGSRLVRCYGNLYSQARVEALEKLDTLPQLTDATELKSKILFSVVVVSIIILNRTGLLLFFIYFLVGVQIDTGHVKPKKRTSEEIIVLSNAVRFGARWTRSFYLFLFETDGRHFRFNPMYWGKTHAHLSNVLL